MEKNKVHINPIVGDKVTFLKTSQETNGVSTLLELDLVANGQGTPPHYHDNVTETFTVIDGELTVMMNGKSSILKKGETVTVPINTIHNFSNASSTPVRTIVELRPGSTGFENSLKIAYGLARDGKCNNKSIPKDINHLALLLIMSQCRLPGLMSVAMPIFRLIADRARKKGIEKELIQKYC